LNRAKPGQRFSDDNFVTTQLSFSEAEKDRIASEPGVTGVASGLTLSAVHVSGRVPKNAPTGGGTVAAPPPGAGGFNGPRSISFNQSTVTGVDFTSPDLALVTPAQIQNGRYFDSTRRREAIVSQSYARKEKLSLGDRITVGGKRYKVIGAAKEPLGGQSSDIYIPLGQLQKLSKREGRVNVLQVRAASGDQVESVAKQIRSDFTGSQVTTAKNLADRVSGSLVDAKNLASKLGTALAIVALAAAFLIAGLLTLSSVNKRTRELGTLKAIGWSQRLVVRQVTGEALAQGALGGAIGALVGIGGAALVSAFAPNLEATVAQAAQQAGPIPFGQGQVASGSTSVALHAPVDVGLIALAVALALAGGLVAGAIGGTRAARLRPAVALRSVE
jgi:ABC-type antimicrobial peptide transport system permease subunit